jgi:hypothetical protein
MLGAAETLLPMVRSRWTSAGNTGTMNTMTGQPKYRAFLSYSHADSRAAAWLHARIEGFRIDKDLSGRETAMGPIPGRLAPVFRGRSGFDAGGSLAVFA